LPKPYFDKMLSMSMSDRSAYMQKRVRDIPVMYDLDTRFRIMEQYDGYTQVLTLNLPPSEFVAGPKESPDLAKLASEIFKGHQPPQYKIRVPSTAANEGSLCS
jgi:uncharacterized protein